MSEQSKDKTEAVAATPAAPVADNGSGSLLALGIGALALMLAGYNFYQSSFGDAAKPASGFYVVDSDRLAASYLTQAMNQSQEQSPEAVQQMLTQNLERVQEKLKDMSDEGLIIIQRSAVVTYPKGADITQRVADELGIALLPAQAAGAAQTSVLPPASLPQDGTATVGGGAELD